ncbi:MAG: hypothetical protein ING36_12370 [Burkholderiales bacterium]|nr:hypothetical protein [Burkholderiales bacterium]
MNKPALRRSLKSNLAQVDAHSIKPSEYKELPEFTNEMLTKAIPGWQTRMAERLKKVPASSATTIKKSAPALHRPATGRR